MTKPFKELKDQMSPEAQQKVDEIVKVLGEEVTVGDVRHLLKILNADLNSRKEAEDRV